MVTWFAAEMRDYGMDGEAAELVAAFRDQAGGSSGMEAAGGGTHAKEAKEPEKSVAEVVGEAA